MSKVSDHFIFCLEPVAASGDLAAEEHTITSLNFRYAETLKKIWDVTEDKMLTWPCYTSKMCWELQELGSLFFFTGLTFTQLFGESHYLYWFVLSTWCKLDSPEKRELSLRNIFCWLELWTSLWSIFFDWWLMWKAPIHWGPCSPWDDNLVV